MPGIGDDAPAMRLTWSLSIASLTLACVARTPSEGESGTTGDPDTGSESTTTTTTDPTDATTTVGSTTTPGTSVGTAMDDTTSTTTDAEESSESFSFITAPDFGERPTDLPNGSECSGGIECESGFCRDAPGPGDGVCSECEMDADCEMGTCSFEFGAGYSVCTDGELGDGCDSDEGCAGALVCAPVFGDDGPGRCSECSDDLACDGDSVCSPVYGDSPFDSWRGCVAPGSVDLGGGCPVSDGIGDGSVCMSGACGVATFGMGNFELGVCSECDGDDDCADGLVCEAPEIGMGGITPGACG